MNNPFPFSDLQDEVIGTRFNESQRSNVKKWLNFSYAKAWGSDRWPWRNVYLTGTGYMTAGSLMGTWPSDLLRANLVLNTTDGSEVAYIDPKNFLRIYTGTNQPTGTTLCHYTAVNNDPVIGFALFPDVAPDVPGTASAPLWGPVPGDDLPLTLFYERSFGHYNSGGSWVFGPMVEDDDYPVWPVEWRYIIVAGAISIGLRNENDDTWQPLEEEFQTGIQLMRSTFLPGDIGVTSQYGTQGSVGV